MTKQAEYLAAKAASKSALEAYWAGSATTSVARDYEAGRVVVIKAKES